MEYICAGYSDKGIVKPNNEDNYGILRANTTQGQIVMAIVCDGVGGLKKGEVASANTIQYFSDWFKTRLPHLLTDFSWDEVRRQWENNLQEINNGLLSYSRSSGMSLGTTMILALFYGGKILMMNVGDSRLYAVSDTINQLSKDQSLVQREVDSGKLRPDQMETDPRRNVLLQCVGATRKLIPEIKLLDQKPETTYFLCSDGFRHKLTDAEILSTMNPAVCTSESNVRRTLSGLVDVVKKRQEQDNITVVAVRTKEA